MRFLLLLLVAGCGPTYFEYVELNAAPGGHPSKAAAAVELLTTPPTRPHARKRDASGATRST